MFNVTGKTSGGFDTFKVVDSSFHAVTRSSPGCFSYDDSTGPLSWTAVPEPSSILVGLLLVLGFFRRSRLRNGGHEKAVDRSCGWRFREESRSRPISMKATPIRLMFLNLPPVAEVRVSNSRSKQCN
jgi:hypothetical protein